MLVEIVACDNRYLKFQTPIRKVDGLRIAVAVADAVVVVVVGLDQMRYCYLDQSKDFPNELQEGSCFFCQEEISCISLKLA